MGVVYVVLALLAPRAPAAVYSQGSVVDTLQATAAALRGSDDGAVSSNGHALQDSLGGATLRFKASLHEVQRPKIYGDKAEIDDMLREAKAHLNDGHMADPAVRENIDRAAALYGARRVRYDGAMADDDMGLYAYLKQAVADGTIKLNFLLKAMGHIMPIDFLTATLVHEVAHQSDGDLAKEGTLDGEVVAFTAQYHWLKHVDPTGERLALLRVELAEQMEKHPNPVTAAAINYAATLDVLVGTGGDKEKIRQFAYDLGYREGQEGPEKGPASA